MPLDANKAGDLSDWRRRQEKSIDDIIEAHSSGVWSELPKERDRPEFALARALKAVPSVTDASPEALRPVVKRWHAMMKAAGGSKPFEDAIGDFARAWKRVKFAAGDGPM